MVRSFVPRSRKGRPSTNEQHEIARELVELAERDWAAAKVLAATTDPLLFAPAGFHAQQCVEKYVKSLLAARSIDYPKIHNLRPLLDLLPMDILMPIDADEARILTGHAVGGRYYERNSITEAEANRSVELAERVRAAAREVLSELL